MDIQVWSDVICPWCYLGKHRLEKAVEGFDTDVTVTFRAFQLDPTPVPVPAPIKESLAAKFGGTDRAEQMFAHVTAIAAGEGLTLNFDRAIAANTFDAHRLVAWAAGQGRQLDMIDALQRAHFTDGIDVGSRAALAAAAGSIGLDASAASDYLESGAGADAVNTDLAGAQELGIRSVPTFVIDGRYAVQGAQEPATLRAALEEIARRESVDTGR
ncbi:MAG TPA: DsbA family oxidoreductase [Actinoplanes sp.]|nr:DsbA family oxidoreductase [Actinoplanes sp.]